MILRGWQPLPQLVPAKIAEALAGIQRNPKILASELERCWTTLIHGDLWVANLGIAEDHVVILDWSLATVAPPAFEFTTFLTGCWSRVAATREEMIDDVRAIYGSAHDERALQLSLIATFVEYGWNKALDALEHPDPTKRARERDELDWWIATVTRALDETWWP